MTAGRSPLRNSANKHELVTNIDMRDSRLESPNDYLILLQKKWMHERAPARLYLSGEQELAAKARILVKLVANIQE